MKIGIDISQIVYETGVSVYTENLVENLSKIDKKNKYKLFAGSLRRRGDVEKFIKQIENRNFKAIVYPFPPTFLNFLWNNIHIYEIENLIGGVDVFHSSDWTQPPTRAKSITTIHDLTPILFPDWSFKKIIDTHKRRLSWVKKEVDLIIVPTKETMKDLVSLGFNEKSIEVIPEAPEQIYKPTKKQDIKIIKNKYGIGGEYILCVGVSPRKNLKRSIKAFKKIKKENSDLSLAIIGHKYEEVEKVDGAIFTGHVNKADLPALYSGAQCLLYPSLYEGFGLPILEAMACGTPVITSDKSSMKEVAGNAAILVNPENVGEIFKGIARCLGNKEALVNKGRKRVKDFSWEKTAKKTLKVYEKILDQ